MEAASLARRARCRVFPTRSPEGLTPLWCVAVGVAWLLGSAGLAGSPSVCGLRASCPPWVWSVAFAPLGVSVPCALLRFGASLCLGVFLGFALRARARFARPLFLVVARFGSAVCLLVGVLTSRVVREDLQPLVTVMY